MKIIKDIILDINEASSNICIEVHQGEVDSRVIRAKIVKDKKTFQIPDTYEAKADANLNNVIVAEDVVCMINPNEGETSIVYIPITKYMCGEPGKGMLNLKLIENGSTVITQDIYIIVVKNATGNSENIYSDIARVNEVLADTVKSETDKTVLDEERLNQLPTLLEESKVAIEETGVEIAEPFYFNDIPSAIQKVYAAGQSTGIITEENDPTVPEWAKQPNPPTYTAKDVGALSSDDIDQTYNSESENAQSGKAVAEAVINAKKISDEGEYFEADTIDGALQEIGAKFGDINTSLDGIEMLLVGI